METTNKPNLTPVWVTIALATLLNTGLWAWTNFSKEESSSAPVKTVLSKDGKTTQPTAVWVNSDTLLEKSEYYNAVKDSLEKEEKRVEADLLQREAKLRQAVQAFQEKAQSGAMNSTQAQLEESNLQRREQEFVQYREAQIGKAEKRRAQVVDRLQGQVDAFLAEYNKGKHYPYIFGYRKAGDLLFADPQLNVTEEVLVGLNKSYQDSKKK